MKYRFPSLSDAALAYAVAEIESVAAAANAAADFPEEFCSINLADKRRQVFDKRTFNEEKTILQLVQKDPGRRTGTLSKMRFRECYECKFSLNKLNTTLNILANFS